MLTLLVFLVLPLLGICRIHHLAIHSDRRKNIPLSTFGFYTGGKLQVDMSGFHLAGVEDYDSLDSVVGFSIDKTVSDTLNPYLQATEKQCILDKTPKNTDNAGIVRFILDFKNKQITVNCSENVRNITILDSPSKVVETVGALSDAGLFKSLSDNDDRLKRNLQDSSIESFFASKLDREIDDHYEKVQEAHPETIDDDINIEKTSVPKIAPTVETNLNPVEKDSPTDVNKVSSLRVLDSCDENSIPLNIDKDGHFETSFVIYISDAKLEGLYSMFFHNCFNYLHHTSKERMAVDFTILIEEKNSDSFLSAGEMPLPALYQMFSILFFLSGCFWIFILKRSMTDQVFRIHWLMTALVFLKSLSLFFHGVNYNKIATNDIHMESWALLYYITHLLKGGLLFFTIVLIGSGWAFVKHVLSSREKKVFMVVLPLQVISNVAYIILEESEQGEASHNFWKEVFVLIDLICCGTILLPVIWSIRHLQDAQNTDGKAAVSLEKLKVFRHFYLMVVCYVYFTRIIVYLLRISVPFQYSWLDSMFKEVATLVFFVMTGYKFRPASSNPYFAVATREEDEEVLIGSTSVREHVTARKAYKIADGEDDESVVLFSKSDEPSH